MASFLRIISYLFLSALIFIGLMIFILYRRVKNVTNMFNKQRQSTQRQETGRKIFTKDEGEYVDYEEEK